MRDILEPGQTYHIFNRGNNREDIFKEERNYVFFLELMKKYLLPSAEIYAYCLMKNHYHLLLRFKEKQTSEVFETSDVLTKTSDVLTDISKKPHRALANMLTAYSKSINKAYHRSGSLFQQHPKKCRITDKNYFIQTVVYIHMNPVKHGFTTSLDYPHSSYRAIISDKPTLLKRDVVLDYFDDVENLIAWHDYKKIQHEMIQKLEY